MDDNVGFEGVVLWCDTTGFRIVGAAGQPVVYIDAAQQRHEVEGEVWCPAAPRHFVQVLD